MAPKFLDFLWRPGAPYEWRPRAPQKWRPRAPQKMASWAPGALGATILYWEKREASYKGLRSFSEASQKHLRNLTFQSSENVWEVQSDEGQY